MISPINQPVQKKVVKLLPQEKKAIANRGTESIEAYECYKRARALRASHTMSGPDRLLDTYRRAIELDPDFAMAWAGLSTAILFLIEFFPIREETDRLREEMEHAFAQAMKLAPTHPDVVASRSARCFSGYDWDAAEECLRLWSEMPNEAWSIRGHLQLALGRAQEAVESQVAVVRADPLSIGAVAVLQLNEDCAGELELADEQYENSKNLPGGMEFLEVGAFRRMMALGDHKRFVERFVASFSKGSPRFPMTAELAMVIDKPAEVLTVVRKIYDDTALATADRMVWAAFFAAYYDEFDLAFALLRRGVVEIRSMQIMNIWHPVFRKLRLDPRFKQILIDTGLANHWRKSGNWGYFARPLGEDDFEIIA